MLQVWIHLLGSIDCPIVSACIWFGLRFVTFVYLCVHLGLALRTSWLQDALVVPETGNFIGWQCHYRVDNTIT